MAFIKRDNSSMGLPMNITRGNPVPLDSTSVWYSLDEAKNYAKTGVTAYVGQILTVVDEENNSSKLYVIKDKAGNLDSYNAGGITAMKTLTIGKYTYDGSADVTVDVYEGEVQE